MLPSPCVLRCAAALLLTVGLLTCRFSAIGQSPIWDRAIGGRDSDRLFAMQAAANGGYLLGGWSWSDISGEKTEATRGLYDYWAVKIDANGAKQWDRTLGTSNHDDLTALLATADGGCLLGGHTESRINGDKTEGNRGETDYWVVKLAGNGTKQWDRTLGGDSYDNLTALLATMDGGYLLGGWSLSRVIGEKTQPSRGGKDYWIVKLDATGNKQWDRTSGGSYDDELTAMVATPDGGYLLGGSSNSGVSGEKTEPSRGETDYWVVKFDATGTKQWDRTFGGSDLDQLTALLVTSDGGYLLGGYSFSDVSTDKTQPKRGKPDYWVVKLTASGIKQWDRTFGGERNPTWGASSYLTTLLTTADGGYLLGGDSSADVGSEKTEPSRGVEDYWVVKLNASGAKQWDRTIGGTSDDRLTAMQSTADGNYLLGGWSRSGITGEKTKPSRGSDDYWVVKLSRDGITATSAAAHAALGVYPNPAHDRLTLRLPDRIPRTGLRLSLLDATGSLVLPQALVPPTGPDVMVEIGQHPAGLYLLRLEGPQGVVATQRLVLH